MATSDNRRRKQSPRRPPRPRRARRAPGTHKERAEDGPERSHDGGERLQKVLAAAGLASRRECEELIREGRVEVDRQVVTELGTRVDPERQEVRVDGEVLHKPKLVYFAVNKPIGVVSTSRDPAGRPRVTDLLPPNAPRSFCVGRLDMSSEGLILVTNDGELANGLTHPRHGVEKVYQVQVAGQVEQEVLTKLERGVHLAEGIAHAKEVRIKSRRKQSTLLEMVLDEGRNREIRRLLAKLGHKVQRLRRIAVGPVRLGEMPPGAVRPLDRREVAALQRAVVAGESAAPTPDIPKPQPSKHPSPNKQRAKTNQHREQRGPRAGRKIIGG